MLLSFSPPFTNVFKKPAQARGRKTRGLDFGNTGFSELLGQ